MENEMTQKPVEEVKEPVAEVSEIINDMTKDSDKSVGANMVGMLADQYQYIQQLETDVYVNEDVSESQLDNISFCKSKILAQLVNVEAFASTLSADDPQQKALNAIRSHLTKTYVKAEKVRARAKSSRFGTEYRKAVAEALYGTNRRQFLHLDEDYETEPNKIRITMPAMALGGTGFALSTQTSKDSILEAGKALMTGDVDKATQALIPQDSRLGIILDLIKDPEARLSAQMQDLIQELKSKQTPDQQASATKWVTSVLGELMGLRNQNAMTSALKGVKEVGIVSQLTQSNGI